MTGRRPGPRAPRAPRPPAAVAGARPRTEQPPHLRVVRDDRGIDWAGLSVRKVRGWFRGSQCLARCSESHRGGRWCLTDNPRGGRRR